jgi:hypothetical protein
MVLKMGNSGAVDVANSWSVGGRMHCNDVHNYFLRKLKDQGLLIIRYIVRDDNDSQRIDVSCIQ